MYFDRDIATLPSVEPRRSYSQPVASSASVLGATVRPFLDSIRLSIFDSLPFAKIAAVCSKSVLNKPRDGTKCTPPDRVSPRPHGSVDQHPLEMTTNELRWSVKLQCNNLDSVRAWPQTESSPV